MSVSDETANAVKGFHFGPFHLDVCRQLLYRNGEPVHLAPRMIKLLSVLVQNHGKDLEKDFLIDCLWPEVAVTENNLTVTMSAVRKALGESPGQHIYILTLSGRGYRFVAPVAEVAQATAETPSPNPESAVVAAPVAQEVCENEDHTNRPSLGGPLFQGKLTRLVAHTKWVRISAALFAVAVALAVWISLKLTRAEANTPVSLVVLPFKPTGLQADSGYLGLGMADALVARLGALRHVVVRPYRSVLQYSDVAYDPKTLGQNLHVAAVLDGTVERKGESVRLSVRLLRVSDGTVLWSNEFSGRFREIFAFQDDIAEQVSRVLTLSPTSEEQRHLRKRYTTDTEAYQIYLRGRYFWNKRTPESIAKAIGYFQQSVSKDPNFALAYAGLADCYNLSAYYSDILASEAFPKAEQAAQKALSVDDTLAEAYNSLALARMDYKWDFPGAEVAYRRALELDPEYATAHQWYAEYLIAMGREQEARGEGRRAQDLDPMSLINNATVGEIEFFSRHYDQAESQLRATLDLDQQFWPAAWFLGWTYEAQGKNREALQLLEKASALSPDDAQIISELAYAYAVNGEKERAEMCLHDLGKTPDKLGTYSYTIALVYSALGDKDAAFRWLDLALQGRCWMLIYTKMDPRMDRLRSDPRFSDIIKRIGLAS